MTTEINDRDERLQGRYAGFVSRLGGFLLDVLLAGVLYALAGQVVQFVGGAIGFEHLSAAEHPAVGRVLLAVWIFIYCAYPLSVNGRTVGMAAVGLRAVRADGSPIRTRDAVLRVLVTPLSFLLLFLGYWMVLFRRDRRALQDVIAGTAVVYAWDARAARLRFLARQPAGHS